MYTCERCDDERRWRVSIKTLVGHCKCHMTTHSAFRRKSCHRQHMCSCNHINFIFFLLQYGIRFVCLAIARIITFLCVSAILNFVYALWYLLNCIHSSINLLATGLCAWNIYLYLTWSYDLRQYLCAFNYPAQHPILLRLLVLNHGLQRLVYVRRYWTFLVAGVFGCWLRTCLCV